MLTIYNTTVPVKDQDQADRLKQICIDYGLPIWEDNKSFTFTPYKKNYLIFAMDYFYICWVDTNPTDKIITEQQFIELLKDTRL